MFKVNDRVITPLGETAIIVDIFIDRGVERAYLKYDNIDGGVELQTKLLKLEA